MKEEIKMKKFLCASALASTFFLLPTELAADHSCVGDIDGDGEVSGADLGRLLASWGSGLEGDLDGDSDTDGNDLTIMLSQWGADCTVDPHGPCGIGTNAPGTPWCPFPSSGNAYDVRLKNETPYFIQVAWTGEVHHPYTTCMTDNSSVPAKDTVIAPGQVISKAWFVNQAWNLYETDPTADSSAIYVGTAQIGLTQTKNSQSTVCCTLGSANCYQFYVDANNVVYLKYSPGQSHYANPCDTNNYNFLCIRPSFGLSPTTYGESSDPTVTGPMLLGDVSMTTAPTQRQGITDSEANSAYWAIDSGFEFSGMSQPGCDGDGDGEDDDPANASDRWTLDTASKTLWLNTGDKGWYGNKSARAFPININTKQGDFYELGYSGNGVAHLEDGGCWQIQMNLTGLCSKQDTGNKQCQTFYLAERQVMQPGMWNYQDAQSCFEGGKDCSNLNPPGCDTTKMKFGVEIDIMETLWQDGPQTNCPGARNNDHDSSWNFSYQGQTPGGTWANAGATGNECPDGWFTFGCLIRGDNLWFYAYKADGSHWYATDPIPRTGLNSAPYKPTGPLVPYVSSWVTDSNNPGDVGTKTGFKNFVYLSPDDPAILGKDPKTNPEAFGAALHSE